MAMKEARPVREARGKWKDEGPKRGDRAPVSASRMTPEIPSWLQQSDDL